MAGLARDIEFDINEPINGFIAMPSHKLDKILTKVKGVLQMKTFVHLLKRLFIYLYNKCIFT